MILREVEFHIIIRIDAFLQIQAVQIFLKRPFPQQIACESTVNIIIIAGVKSLVEFRIRQAVLAVRSYPLYKTCINTLRQPECAGAHFFNRCSGPLPEIERNKGRHVTAEPVHILRPIAQGLDQVIPESRVTVVQVHNIPPLFDLGLGLTVLIPVEPLGMFNRQNRVRGSVIVNNINNALHPALMDLFCQPYKVFYRSEIRVDGAIIRDRIGRTYASFPSDLTDGMNRHEPDDVRPQ